MANPIMCGIVNLLTERKGCSLEELYDALPYRWSNTDALKPMHLLLPSLKELINLGLVEAYHSGEIIDPERFWGSDSDGHYIYEKLKFYISPKAVGMSESLGIDFVGRYSPVFGQPSRRTSWPQIFVLMPFAQELTPVYEDHIKKVVSSMGRKVARADDFFTTESIIGDIWSAIFHALVVVADCTGRNPNVFYEIGIAHTLGRDTILLTQSQEDVPFDLRHLRIIQYEFTPSGMKVFETRLEKTIRSLFWDRQSIQSSG